MGGASCRRKSCKISIGFPFPCREIRSRSSTPNLIRGKDRNLLIDTGFRQPACREALFAGLRELGLRRGDVDVLLTHLHSDHAGLAPEAAGETGTIFVSSVDRLTLDNMAERQKYWEEADNRFREEGFPISMMMQIRDKNPAGSMAPPTGGHYSSLEDGDVLEAGDYRLQCLLMPRAHPGPDVLLDGTGGLHVPGRPRAF